LFVFGVTSSVIKQNISSFMIIIHFFLFLFFKNLGRSFNQGN
jgi:hypothetical protein